MPHRLEISLKNELPDPLGQGVARKALDYFGIAIDTVRAVDILTIDADLSARQLESVRDDIFTNPVTQVSSYRPLSIPFDWLIWVGYRPGVRDNAGATAVEAIEDYLQIRFTEEQAVYTSRRFCLRAPDLSRDQADRIAGELLANDIIQQWQVFHRMDWNPEEGIGIRLPKVLLDHRPTVTPVAIDSDDRLRQISDERNLALNPQDIPTIRAYFLEPSVRKERRDVNLGDPTDVELEYLSQARSDHCNHNTFRGRFHYTDEETGLSETVDNLFRSFIEVPTLALQKQKPWVVSVLWDNAGVGRFDADTLYTITGETHNSPSNMEAYGGALTGIVGIYRDPMGTGKGSRLIMGSYGFCVGPRDYSGELKPRLHPRRLLDGVIEGVRDGGNKSGIPTVAGQTLFHPGYMGKCLVFVTAVGLMPALIKGKPADQKEIVPGDHVVMCGGRVGKDGIHGVTAASESFDEHTPAGHVQIGDPYTQKKMHDFLLEARDEGLVRFITDNGGGGLSSSVGESARFSNGVLVELDRVPLKYAGLDQWEIWVSESQERMTVAVAPEHIDRFLELSRKHAVESTVIGRYTDTGKLHILYEGETCAYVDLKLLTAGFPQWEFEARWLSPEHRGLCEPAMRPPVDHTRLLLDMLERPNICSKEWITRQYDHEVQGTSVVKPLLGPMRDVPGDAAVLRPRLDSRKGLAFAQALLPQYSAIDAYHMTACTMDEAVRRLIAVGADPAHMGGVDNFCWPDIQAHPETNPDGAFKAAQLVRSCRALKAICLSYGIPLLSGKDSMYVDGYLAGRYGEFHKVSALETLQFSAVSVVEDIEDCVTPDPKSPGDLLYVLGVTRNELGGSEYYERFGYIGKNVPQVRPESFLPLYRSLHHAMGRGLVESAHGVYRGGLAVHLAMVAMAGGLGLHADLTAVTVEGSPSEEQILYSESAGRFIVTIAPENRDAFEAAMAGHPVACVGRITEDDGFILRGVDETERVSTTVAELREVWKRPFGDLI